MPELTVVHEDMELFDTVEISTDHRLEYEDGTLTAAYPSEAGTTKVVMALFNVTDGTVDLPPDSAVLNVTDTVTALVPVDEYGGAE